MTAAAVRSKDMRYTLRDPSLEHQVVLELHGSKVTVSCNCQVTASGGYRPVSSVSEYREVVQAYNDPANHRKPFDPAQWGLVKPIR